MDKQKASTVLAIAAPIILVATAVVGIYFPRASIWLFGGVIIALAFVASRLKR